MADVLDALAIAAVMLTLAAAIIIGYGERRTR